MILPYLVHMHSSKGVHTASGGTQQSGMEGKPILGSEGYNGLFALLLASVSCPSVQNGTQGKESYCDGTQVRTNFLVVHK